MKSFIVLALCFVAALASPLPTGDVAIDAPIDIIQPEPLLSEIPADELPEDWQLIPDGDGNMHMVDINHQQPEPRFNAWDAVRVLLVTRANRNNPMHILLNNAAQLRSSPFNPALQTRFIMHGWNNDGNSGVNRILSNAYLDRGNFNVFIVDWGAGANTANYAAARNRINDVGHMVAQFVDFLNIHGAPFSSITLVGHSLGGHMAGIVGKRVTRGRIQNIVALDPANPLFSLNTPATRVHYTDAVYVEIIHTDIGRLGFNEPIGHASFYPNWGRGMPGCVVDPAGTCGHSRAWEFFAETISASNAFWGTPCANGFAAIQNQNCSPVGANHLMGGEPVTRAPNGVYFLTTNARAPFGQGRR